MSLALQLAPCALVNKIRKPAAAKLQQLRDARTRLGTILHDFMLLQLHGAVQASDICNWRTAMTVAAMVVEVLPGGAEHSSRGKSVVARARKSSLALLVGHQRRAHDSHQSCCLLCTRQC